LKDTKTIISVVTVCKDAERHIEETMLSVLEQKNKNEKFEIQYIIYDGDSKDNTNKIIEKYKNKYSEIEHYIEKDEGLYDGLVKGFAKCKGSIVSYINAGDFYYKNAFNNIVKVFSNFQEIKWITGAKVIYNEDSEIIKYIVPFNYRKRLIRVGAYGKNLPFIQQESTFWRKELLDTVNFDYFKTLKKSGDMYLWYSFAKEQNLYTIDSYLSGFKFHENQLTFKETGNTDLYLEEAKSFLNKKYIFDYFSIIIDSFFWFLSKYHSNILSVFNKNNLSYNLNQKKWLKENLIGKKEYIAWASEINQNQGEGKLAHNFINYFSSLNSISVNVKSLNNKMYVSKGSVKRSDKPLFTKKTNLNFFEKYIGPIYGVIYLWFNFLIGNKTIYINFTPLWNFLIFLLLPPNTTLGPITGTTKLETKNLWEKYLRKYLMPICFRISIFIMNIRYKSALFATENLKDVVKNKLKIKRFYNFSLSEINKISKKDIINFDKRKYDFCIYYRRYPTKNNEFFEKIISYLSDIDQKVVIVGDKINLDNLKNVESLGMLNSEELEKILSNTKFSIVSDETLFSFFTIDCMKFNINIFCNDKDYNLDAKLDEIYTKFHKINFAELSISKSKIKDVLKNTDSLSAYQSSDLSIFYKDYF
jgi:glycosyltransferase involved in cell wall biosynthesis